MKSIITIVLLLTSLCTWAQEPVPMVDSLAVPEVGDSTLNNLDDLTLPVVSDSTLSKLDSIVLPEINTAKLDSVKQNTQAKIDSLQNLGLPTKKYTQKLDSLDKLGGLEEKKQQLATGISEKKEALEGKTSGITEFGSKVSKETGSPEGQLSAGEGGLPDSNIPDLNLPEVDLPVDDVSIPDIEVPEVDVKNLNAKETLEGLKDIDQLDGVTDKVDELGGVTSEVKGYTEELKEFKEEGVLNKGGELLEEQAGSIDEIKGLQEDAFTLDEFKSNEGLQLDKLETLNDKEEAKEELVAEGVKQVTEHLSNQSAKLEAAFSKLSKYKKKYKSLESIRKLPEKVPNPMADEPFVHRIIPGFVMEVARKYYSRIDIGPSFGYKITDKWRIYGAYTYRFYYDYNNEDFDWFTDVYGPKLSVTYTFFRGFYIINTLETLRADVPRGVNIVETKREWVNGVLLGVGKEYDFMSKVKGNVQFMYNFLYNENSPYIRKFNIRFGFNFEIKESRKKQQKRIDRKEKSEVAN